MKKLYCWLLAVMLPVIVYCTVFFLNDPYDYFGTGRKKTDTYGVIGKMLAYRNHDYDALLIGDSRTQHCDLTELSEKSGRNYFNMSYGGSMTTEMNTLLRWCLDNQPVPLKEVIIISSFHNMNTLLQQDRVAATEKVIESPMFYVFSIDTAKEMFKQMLAEPEEDSTTEFLNRTPEERKKIFDSYKERMKYFFSGYTYDYDALEGMEEICDLCRERGIQVTIVLPPWQAEYYDMLEQYQQLSMMDEYKQRLSHHARVMDFEYPECELSSRRDEFSDLAHFYLSTMDDFMHALAYNDNTYCRIWEDGVLYPQGAAIPG